MAAITQEIMTMGVILASNSTPPAAVENPPAGMVAKKTASEVPNLNEEETETLGCILPAGGLRIL